MLELDTKLVDKVRGAGLSDKEAQVYVALLASGGAFPSKLSEITRLNRTTVYKVLEGLTIKGLVTELEKRKKFFYQVENPKNLERYAASRVTLAKRGVESLETILPTLEGLFAGAENKPIVRFFEGEEGVLKVYEDHVASDTPYEMLAFSNTSDLMRFLTPEFRERYIKRKAKVGITTRAVLPDEELDINYNESIYKDFPQKIWPVLRHVSRDKFPYKSDLTIYGGNKVSIINFSEPQFAATIIEDQVIHDMMTMIFELSWQGVPSKK